jgi:hypothetical protein
MDLGAILATTLVIVALYYLLNIDEDHKDDLF